MKLHHLEITGIGPFAETETVDFDRLDESGVFLLTGRTGSGKTTVLDGVSYAIFGAIPRDPKGGNVVSHHRRLDTTPRVVLEATIGGIRLKVTRTPEHERPARRGGGTTRQAQSLLVEQHSAGGWEAVTSKWSEGNEWLQDRIGMTVGQFGQVVMLPQGQFSRFLDASTTDRRALLQRLFPDTDLAWLEGWLRERASRAARERDDKLQEIGHRFQRVLPVARRLAAEDEDPLPDHSDGNSSREWIRDRRRRLDHLSEAAERARLEAQDAWDEAETRLRELEKRAELVLKRRQADAELSILEKRAGWRQATGRELDAARRAAGVVPLATAASARTADRETARDELERLRPIIGSSPVTAGIPADGYPELHEELAKQARQVDEFIWTELSKRSALANEAARLEARLESLAGTGPDGPAGQARAVLEDKAAATGEAKSILLGIREARNRGMAAELAGQLEEGAPCPVCGSTDHPSPATGAQEVPAESAEKEAQEAVAKAERAEDAARTALAEAESRIAAEKATAETSLARIHRDLKALTDRERELRGEAGAIEDRRDELHNSVELLASFLDARTKLEAASAEADRAVGSAAATADEQGFESVEAALAAAIEPDRLKELEQEVGEHDRKLSIVQNALAGELSGIDAGEEIDLAPAKEAAASSSRLRDEAAKIANRAADDLKLFGEEMEPVAGLYEDLAPLRVAADRTAELNRLASGKNERSMPLSIFMLATRLRQVIVAANRHFAGMSDQRYTLVYSGDRAGYGATSGLGIDVHDSHTSESRPTATLSGGEKFCAALSLALGLAEIVQAESDGKSLQSLFIDEGFGTLDAKSLDQVMTVIDSLRENGRSVGLVSHVEELRNRIGAQIQVTGSREGSTIRVVTG